MMPLVGWPSRRISVVSVQGLIYTELQRGTGYPEKVTEEELSLGRDVLHGNRKERVPEN